MVLFLQLTPTTYIYIVAIIEVYLPYFTESIGPVKLRKFISRVQISCYLRLRTFMPT